MGAGRSPGQLAGRRGGGEGWSDSRRVPELEPARDAGSRCRKRTDEDAWARGREETRGADMWTRLGRRAGLGFRRVEPEMAETGEVRSSERSLGGGCHRGVVRASVPSEARGVDGLTKAVSGERTGKGPRAGQSSPGRPGGWEEREAAPKGEERRPLGQAVFSREQWGGGAGSRASDCLRGLGPVRKTRDWPGDSAARDPGARPGSRQGWKGARSHKRGRTRGPGERSPMEKTVF